MNNLWKWIKRPFIRLYHWILIKNYNWLIDSVKLVRYSVGEMPPEELDAQADKVLAQQLGMVSLYENDPNYRGEAHLEFAEYKQYIKSKKENKNE